MAEVQTEGGRLYHFVAIERARKFAVAELHAKATRRIAAHVLRALIAAVPDKIHTVWTDHGTSFTALTHVRNGADQQEEVQHPEGVSLIQAYEPCLSTRSFRHVPSPRVRPSNMLLGCPPVCCMAHRKMTSTSAHGTSTPDGHYCYTWNVQDSRRERCCRAIAMCSCRPGIRRDDAWRDIIQCSNGLERMRSPK